MKFEFKNKTVEKLIPIEGNSLLDVNGKLMRVGSDVIDVNGNTRKVSKVVDVYERDFDTAMTKYMSRVAHQVSVHKHFPLEFNSKTGNFESEAGSEWVVGTCIKSPCVAAGNNELVSVYR